MSTNPKPRKAVSAPAALLSVLALSLLGLSACAGPAPQPGHGFSEVRLHRVPPPPEPSYLQAKNAVAPTPPPIPVDPTAAPGRVEALLVKDGFTVEANRDGALRELTATRMAGPKALNEEAACALKAMHRPDFSASDLEVRFDPDRVAVTSRFVLIDTNLISGDLTRQTCRSNGALEAAVRRAAAG